MKEMLFSSIDPSGTITISAAQYDPSDLIPKIDVYAPTGFIGWVLKIKDGKSTINNEAPSSVISRIYDLIVW
jgi:hypothetical protein